MSERFTPYELHLIVWAVEWQAVQYRQIAESLERQAGYEDCNPEETVRLKALAKDKVGKAANYDLIAQKARSREGSS